MAGYHYWRPFRGKKATAIAKLTTSTPLQKGEVFFEVPDTGVGTGYGKIKMGDGKTAYEALPYFTETVLVDYDELKISFEDSDTHDEEPLENNPIYATNINPISPLKSLFSNIKKLILNYNYLFENHENRLSSQKNSIDINTNNIDKADVNIANIKGAFIYNSSTNSLIIDLDLINKQ